VPWQIEMAESFIECTAMKFLGLRHRSVDVEHDRLEPIQVGLAPTLCRCSFEDREAKLTDAP
jgi:hypothetical protein